MALAEYFYATNPSVPDGFTAFSVQHTSDQVIFAYDVSKSLSGIKDRVQWSTDLTTWHAGGVAYDPDQDGATCIRRTARIPVTGKNKIFVRLEVTQD